MNKEQSADDPSIGSDSCKYICSTISMSYPDVVIVEHKVSLEAYSEQRQRVKHDNNMKDYSLVVDWCK